MLIVLLWGKLFCQNLALDWPNITNFPKLWLRYLCFHNFVGLCSLFDLQISRCLVIFLKYDLVIRHSVNCAGVGKPVLVRFWPQNYLVLQDFLK